MNDFNAHILADEAKTGANIEGAITIKKADESENKEEVKIDGKED